VIASRRRASYGFEDVISCPQAGAPSAGSTRYLVDNHLGMAQAGRMAGRGLEELPFSWAGDAVATSPRVFGDLLSTLHGMPVCQ
jgi:hypothetical protein